MIKKPCFAELLHNAVNDNNQKYCEFFLKLAFGLGVPLVLSLLSAYGLTFIPEKWGVPKEIIFVNTIKIASIMTLAFHTQMAVAQIPSELGAPRVSYNSPIMIYRLISLYMVLVVMVLEAETLVLLLPVNLTHDGFYFSKITEFVHRQHVVCFIMVGSFFYMVIFLIGNIVFRMSNPNNIGIERFTRAFIYGTNIPFIVAFIVVITIYFNMSLLLNTKPDVAEMFLAGAVAFLIYSSTVASICIDHYARPFLAIHQAECQNTQEPAQ